MNKVILCGNLGRNPDNKRTANQNAVCAFSMATTEKRKAADGQWTDHVEWHNIVTFGKTAENCGKYLQKGSQVLVEGKLQTDKYEKDGVTKYSTKIIAERVQFLSKAEKEQKNESTGDVSVSLPERTQAQIEDEDDIPF